MKFYYGDKLLFIDMHHHYTHCVVMGEDRVITCQKTLLAAEQACRDIRCEKLKRAESMERLLEKGYEYSSVSAMLFGVDIKDLYPTAGLLHGAIRGIRKNAESVRVVPLRVEP